jgi:hypothetical protein
MSKNQFSYDGRSFETKAAQTGEHYEVRIFEGDVPANNVVYSVSFNIKMDMAAAGMDAIGELRKMAEDDFKRWNDWLKKQGKTENNHKM